MRALQAPRCLLGGSWDLVTVSNWVMPFARPVRSYRLGCRPSDIWPRTPMKLQVGLRVCKGSFSNLGTPTGTRRINQCYSVHLLVTITIALPKLLKEKHEIIRNSHPSK